MDATPSSTAMATAVARGRHRLYDEPPWVLDDPFALPLVGPIWRLVERRATRHYPPPVERAYTAGIVARSRYTEDRLVMGDYEQYVILGAGLDSFVWRRPDLVRALTVFEVDHPLSQAAKRDRAAVLALPEPPGVVYVPTDFEKETLEGRLGASAFDWSARTFFSWLGVTMYLSVPAIETTLRTVARCAAGSEIVFTYAPPADHLDEIGRRFDEIAGPLVAESGEPLVTYLVREEAERVVRRVGLEVADHPTHAALAGHYFSSRNDGLVPYTAEGVLAARQPGG